MSTLWRSLVAAFLLFGCNDTGTGSPYGDPRGGGGDNLAQGDTVGGDGTGDPASGDPAAGDPTKGDPAPGDHRLPGDACIGDGKCVDCNQLVADFVIERAQVDGCSDAGDCTASYLGTGCSNSLFPVCGFYVNSGADLSTLEAIDAQYVAAACTLIGMCPACTILPPAVCTGGHCEPES